MLLNSAARTFSRQALSHSKRSAATFARTAQSQNASYKPFLAMAGLAATVAIATQDRAEVKGYEFDEVHCFDARSVV